MQEVYPAGVRGRQLVHQIHHFSSQSKWKGYSCCWVGGGGFVFFFFSLFFDTAMPTDGAVQSRDGRGGRQCTVAVTSNYGLEAIRPTSNRMNTHSECNEGQFHFIPNLI